LSGSKARNLLDPPIATKNPNGPRLQRYKRSGKSDITTSNIKKQVKIKTY